MRAWLATALCLVVGCAAPNTWETRAQSPPAEYETKNSPKSNRTLYVVGHGWHTGLVLPYADISRTDWPESGDFFDAKFVEVGWGDEGFYRADHITPQLVAKAAFLPTPSVMHVVGLKRPVEEFFVASDIIELQVTAEGFDRLCRFIHEGYQLDASGEPEILGHGLYGESFFYRAGESYYFPKTCNYWTARALAAAGVKIVPQLSMTAGAVLGQVRPQGRSLNKSSPTALLRALF
jgi:uncharacterized protein (TIGR02117 family)